MTAVELLADAALSAPSAPAAEYLRVLTLGNLAAGAGELGRAGALIEAVAGDAPRPADAALRLAMRLHARTQDDFYPEGRCHVGAVTLAATLALADRVETRTLECLAAGYETMCAVSAVYSAVAQRRGYRPTGMFGTLGAAASAAQALDLGRDGIANAVALATVMSAGTNQSWVSGTDEWLIEIGAAARAGLEAALLTEAGVEASPVAIEGPAGWGRAFFDDPSAATLLTALARPTSRIQAVAAKPFPVSGIAQVATKLGCDLHRRIDGRCPDRILVRMSAAELAYPGSANRGPFQSRSDALMSVAFCVACAVRDGLVGLDALEHPNEPSLQALVDRVELEEDGAVAETEALVTAAVGAETVELAGAGAHLLYPSWDAAAADLPALAERSEAERELVERARVLLEDERPDARRLRELLEGAE